MLYMLDTDICSYLIKAKYPALAEKVREASAGGSSLSISVVTYLEMRVGAERSSNPDKHHHLIDEFCERLQFIAHFGTDDADMFAKVQARLLRDGTPIGVNDAMIAAHAISNDAVLVSNNVRHYSKVSGLTFENWVSG